MQLLWNPAQLKETQCLASCSCSVGGEVVSCSQLFLSLCSFSHQPLLLLFCDVQVLSQSQIWESKNLFWCSGRINKNWNWSFFDSGNFQETGTRGSLVSKISNLWNLRLLKISNNCSMLVQEPKWIQYQYLHLMFCLQFGVGFKSYDGLILHASLFLLLIPSGMML